MAKYVYATTAHLHGKEFLVNRISQSSMWPYDVTIYGELDGEPFKHTFAAMGKSARELLSNTDKVPFWAGLTKRGSYVDLVMISPKK